MTPAVEFEKLIIDASYRHQRWKVFSDFCELAAITLSNVIIKDEEREKRYMQILSGYDETEREVFPRLLAVTICALEEQAQRGELDDFLGHMFMSLELGSHWHGQFFTPIHISKLMARVSMDDFADKIQRRGFVTATDPACGAGSTLLALACIMREQGYNYQTQLYVECTDLDATAANMCFIQLALHHIPAKVWTGNSLSGEMQGVRYTPAYMLGLWDVKLRKQEAVEHPAAPILAKCEKITVPVLQEIQADSFGQLSLL